MSAQANRARAGPILDDAHNACGSHAAMDGNAPFSELGSDDVGGAVFLETEFRVGVNIAANRGDGCGLRNDGIEHVHGVRKLRWQRPSLAPQPC